MDISLSDVLTFLRLILDILVVWALIYSAFRLVRNNSRTIQILKGLLVIMIVKVLAVWIGLNTLSYLIDLFLNWGIVAILILFQPEIRGMLEKVGKTTAILPNEFQISQYTNMINELVDACTDMSNSKTGALITIEQSNSLNDYIQSGIRMDSQVSRELLGTIFQCMMELLLFKGHKLLAQLPIFHQQQKIFLVNMELDIEPLWESVKLRILLPLLCLKKQEIFLSLIEDN